MKKKCYIITMAFALACAITIPSSTVEAASCCGKAGTHDVPTSQRSCTSGCTVNRVCNSCGSIVSSYYQEPLGHNYEYSHFMSMHSPYIYFSCTLCGDVKLEPKYW